MLRALIPDVADSFDQLTHQKTDELLKINVTSFKDRAFQLCSTFQLRLQVSYSFQMKTGAYCVSQKKMF